MDMPTVPNPITPIQVLAGLLENAQPGAERDTYTITVTGDLYRLWTSAK